MRRSAPPPATVPSDLDWTTIAARIREATLALRRLRAGLAPTDRGGLVNLFEPAQHDLGLVRVVLADRAPAGLDFGDHQPPDDFFIPGIERRRPIPADRLAEFEADADLVHRHLVALAEVRGLDARLRDRLDRAAGTHRDAWAAAVAPPDSRPRRRSWSRARRARS